MRHTPPLSVIYTSLWLVCWSSVMLLLCGFLCELTGMGFSTTFCTFLSASYHFLSLLSTHTEQHQLTSVRNGVR